MPRLLPPSIPPFIPPSTLSLYSFLSYSFYPSFPLPLPFFPSILSLLLRIFFNIEGKIDGVIEVEIGERKREWYRGRYWGIKRRLWQEIEGKIEGRRIRIKRGLEGGTEETSDY
jgi:hypothetical protein